MPLWIALVMKMWRPTSIVNSNENRIRRFAFRSSLQISFHRWAIVIGEVNATAQIKTSALSEVFLDANVRLWVCENEQPLDFPRVLVAVLENGIRFNAVHSKCERVMSSLKPALVSEVVVGRARQI